MKPPAELTIAEVEALVRERDEARAEAYALSHALEEAKGRFKTRLDEVERERDHARELNGPWAEQAVEWMKEHDDERAARLSAEERAAKAEALLEASRPAMEASRDAYDSARRSADAAEERAARAEAEVQRQRSMIADITHALLTAIPYVKEWAEGGNVHAKKDLPKIRAAIGGTPPPAPRVGARVTCRKCGRDKAPIGRSIPMAAHGTYCDDDTCDAYRDEPKPDTLWPKEEAAPPAPREPAPTCGGPWKLTGHGYWECSCGWVGDQCLPHRARHPNGGRER